MLEYKCSSINPNNKKEIDNDLYGVICSSSDYKSNTYIYAYYLFINTVQGNPYMQEHFDEINMDASGITDKTEIEDNGPSDASVDVIDDTTIQVIYRLEKGVEIDCNTLDEDTQNDLGCRVIQTVIIKDKNGNQISADIDSYDYCKKNYCYKEIKVDAGKVTCDKTDRIIIKTQRERSCGSKSVKRYTSCGSSTGTQIMYSFEADENCNEDSKVTEEIETFLNCEPCNINSRVVKPTCDGKNTDGIATGMAGDPSLNCILHKTSFNDENATGDMPTDASYYDYSDIFNVNTNICRVYCSDRVEYYLPDKQSATNGLQLKYDIESRVFKDRTDDEKSVHSLTSVVMVKRDCVSEIFYDDVSFDYYKDWKTAYGLSEQPYNWRELYDMLTETSKNEASRTEVLNDLIYDLYNCNLFANGDIPSTIKKSKDKVLVLDSAKKLLDNSKSYCSGESCVNGSVVYEGGAKYIEAQDSYYFTGQNGVDPALTSEVKVYDDINLRYCNKNECFRGADAGDDFPEDYDAAKTSSSFENVKFNGKNVNVPSNDYAIFSYTLEADLYNSTRYQVEQHTGNVEVVKNNEFKDEYLTLNEYVYPIASSVNNVCDAIKSDSNNNSVINYVCDISYSISPIIYSKVISERTAFTRKSTSDDFLRNIGEVQNFACEYDVNRTPDEPDDCPASDPSCTSLITNGSEMFVFKNIDLENPFPVKRTGTNWDGNQGTEYSNYVSKVINEIKESGKNDLYATDEYLEYSYVLTPTAIESIRVYNSGHSYSDKTYNCTIEDNKFFNCKSEFLDYLHEDSNPTGIIINKSDGKSQHSEEAE